MEVSSLLKKLLSVSLKLTGCTLKEELWKGGGGTVSRFRYFSQFLNLFLHFFFKGLQVKLITQLTFVQPEQ